MLGLLVGLLPVSHAYMFSDGVINVSTPLEGFTSTPLRVVFYDFDKTLTVNSTGDEFLRLCDPNCATYTPVGLCPCNQTTTAFGDFLVANLSENVFTEGSIVFNGTDRRDRLISHLTALQNDGVELKILSTSHFYLNGASWQYFIFKIMEIAGLDTFFPLDSIIALDDPGEDIPADKPGVMSAYLSSRGWGPQNSLFVDDHQRNVDAATGSSDWLRVVPDKGLANNQLDWIESRAAQAFGAVCTCVHGVATVNTSLAPETLCEQDNIEDCSECNPGYVLSAPAGTGAQACLALNCTALSPEFGVANTCDSSRQTGEDCTISCLNGYSLSGPATQLCVGAVGSSAFEDTQSCEPVACAGLVLSNGDNNTCTTDLKTGDSCTITCHDGYVLVGPASQECVGTGPGLAGFENTQTCQAVNCSSLVIPNAKSSTCTNDRQTGDTCTITCQDGYILAGPPSQQCLATGPDSAAFEDTQSCQPVNCSSLSTVAGSNSSTCTDDLQLGDNCTITCESGFTLTGPASQQCVATGPGTAAFENTQSCQQDTVVGCETLSVVGGSANTCNSSRVVGENCTITCDTGYALMGPIEQSCIDNGTAAVFENTQSCQAVVCAPPNVPNGTAGTCVNKRVGQNCSIACGPGSMLLGPTVQTCTATGETTAAFPLTQQCVVRPPGCPTSDIALFFSACSSTDIKSNCGTTCGTAASWLIKAFDKFKSTDNFTAFVENCIRNASALSVAPLSPANLDYTIARINSNSGPICQVSNAVQQSAFFALLLALVVSAL